MDAVPSASNGCPNGIGKPKGEEGDIPLPLVGRPSPSPLPGSLQRRFSTQGNDFHMRCRGAGESTSSFGGRASPLTNIVFLEDFTKEKIGSGFFATVYKVQHHCTGQVLAAKINTCENNWDNVQHEIQFMCRVSHPNIVRLMGLCIHEGNLHPLLEYINGGTLTGLLCDSQVYLSWPIRIGLATDISGAMAHLHKKCIMHRDLTSSNVLIKRVGLDRRAVICDLGLSCRFPREHSGLKSPVGTPFWMAPECLHFKPYDEKVDVFSFGIILCEIIIRATADPDELPRRKDFGLDEKAFQALAGNCPEPLKELAFLCCNMNPSSRPGFVDVEFQLQHIKIKLGRQERDKGTFQPRSRRHTVYLNVPNTPTPAPPTSPTSHRLVRSNSDRGSRDRRLSRQGSRTNPFNTSLLLGGRTKFVNSGREHLKQLSPDMSINIEQVLSTLFGPMEFTEIFQKPVKRRLSVSLPSSPEMHRREMSADDDDFFEDFMSWASSPEPTDQIPDRTPRTFDEAVEEESPPSPAGESSNACQSSEKCDTNCNGVLATGESSTSGNTEGETLSNGVKVS
ncbi:dual specificity testis-specific protein kinase 2-like [Diadema antillarum]|uniref:dual specificity testis-specific protein kinase 2-like n=1 Tax=Diadema antillarum TaxID=105358 RepID=UPI003A846513